MDKKELAIMLKKYVAHKAMVARGSDHYKKLSFIAPLERCQALVKRVPEMKSAEAAAGLILRHYPDLMKILPNMGNKSFTSSYNNLQELAKECSKLLPNANYQIH